MNVRALDRFGRVQLRSGRGRTMDAWDVVCWPGVRHWAFSEWKGRSGSSCEASLDFCTEMHFNLWAGTASVVRRRSPAGIETKTDVRIPEIDVRRLKQALLRNLEQHARRFMASGYLY